MLTRLYLTPICGLISPSPTPLCTENYGGVLIVIVLICTFGLAPPPYNSLTPVVHSLLNMKDSPFLSDISGLLIMYGSIVEIRPGAKLTAHQLRVLLAIHYFQQTQFRANYSKIEEHTFIWKASTRQAVKTFVAAGLVKPVRPRHNIELTEEGVLLIAKIERLHKAWRAKFRQGKPVKNKPRQG